MLQPINGRQIEISTYGETLHRAQYGQNLLMCLTSYFQIQLEIAKLKFETLRTISSHGFLQLCQKRVNDIIGLPLVGLPIVTDDVVDDDDNARHNFGGFHVKPGLEFSRLSLAIVIPFDQVNLPGFKEQKRGSFPLFTFFGAVKMLIFLSFVKK